METIIRSDKKITVDDLFTTAKRGEKDIIVILNEGNNPYYNKLRDVIYNLHGRVFPVDAVYELTRDIVDYYLNCGYDSCYELQESILTDRTTYTSDINYLYKELSCVLENTYDSFKEYFWQFEGDHGWPSPLEYHTKTLRAYLCWMVNIIGEFLQDIGAISERSE